MQTKYSVGRYGAVDSAQSSFVVRHAVVDYIISNWDGFKRKYEKKVKNKAPLEQKSRKESYRLRMTLESALEQEPRRKSNGLQMMQGKISEIAEGKLECQRNAPRALQEWFFEKIQTMLPIPTTHQ
ncbi:hypothetical protein TNCV_1595671 [Trichonephila clavipes]|nr:hypothetical protein TNCV_1595671 [Trichonephila clavipes]